MPTTIDKIVDSFPFQTIDPVVGTPTYQTISEVHLKLNSNAASVHSNLGDGAVGLIYLTLSPAVYNTLSATVFLAPVNPGASAVVPAGSTATQISELHYAHTISKTVFHEYDRTDKAFRQQLLSAIDEHYVRALRNKYIGYGNLSTRAILDHLYSTYANILASDLQENNSKLRAPYDANQPIETLTDQVENAVEYAASGNTPYTPEQVVSVAYQLVFQTGLFVDDCKTWRRKDHGDKIWTNFKVFFATAHQEWRESQVTTTGAGFQTANAVVYQKDTVDAIANLATATASDCASVAALTATNSTLTTELTSCQAKLVVALQAFTKLTTHNAELRRHQASSQPRLDPTNSHYCWTHGFKCDHPGFRCPAPACGHEPKATSIETKGGTTKIAKPL